MCCGLMIPAALLSQDIDDPDLQILQVAVATINEFFRTLHGHGFWLPDGVRARVAECGKLFLEGYCTLAARAAAEGLFLFKLRPKMHMLAELIYGMSGDEPRAVPNILTSSCWTDEDFIGVVSQTSRSSHSGSTGLALSLRTMQKVLGRYKIQFAKCEELA